MVAVLVVKGTTVEGTWRYEAQNVVAELWFLADVRELLTFGQDVDVAALLAGISCAATASSAAMTTSRSFCMPSLRRR